MNEIWIYDVIGEGFFESGVTDKSFRDELKEFNQNEDLTVRINSPGGSVHHATAIKTMLDQWSGKVNVQVDGIAASAATYIAMAGDTVSIAEGATFMVHNPWTTLAGDSAELRKAADVLDKTGGKLADAYQRKTGLSLSNIQQMMDAETWLDAPEAVSLGFADSLIAEHEPAEFLVPAAMGFRNMPEQFARSKPKQRKNNTVNIWKYKLAIARAMS